MRVGGAGGGSGNLSGKFLAFVLRAAEWPAKGEGVTDLQKARERHICEGRGICAKGEERACVRRERPVCQGRGRSAKREADPQRNGSMQSRGGGRSEKREAGCRAKGEGDVQRNACELTHRGVQQGEKEVKGGGAAAAGSRQKPLLLLRGCGGAHSFRDVGDLCNGVGRQGAGAGPPCPSCCKGSCWSG